VAACCGKVNSLQKIWNLAKEKLRTKEVHKKLFVQNHEQTVEVSAIFSEFVFLQNSGQWAKQELTTEEMERNCFSHR